MAHQYDHHSSILYIFDFSPMAEWQDPKTIALWITVAFAIILVLGIVIVFFVRLHLKRMLLAQRKLSSEKLMHQKELLEYSVEIQERERKRIASDLHDELIGQLNVIRLSIASKNPTIDTEDMLSGSIAAARRISHDLSPPLLEETPFDEWICNMASPLRAHYAIRLNLWKDPSANISKDVKLQLIRILQEFINNSIKHAKATTLGFSLRVTKSYIALQITDDGKGFDTKRKSQGLGLKNMELRMQLLKGQYRLKSSIDSGTDLLILVKTPSVLNTPNRNQK